MAIELAQFNIQVNAIAPGFIDTDMVAPFKTMPLYEQIIARTPVGRFGTPEECAGTAIYLASQASDFVTGTTLFLDGGYAIPLLGRSKNYNERSAMYSTLAYKRRTLACG